MKNRWKRLVYFLLLNVVVSALTTWSVVSLMIRNSPETLLSGPIPTQAFSVGVDQDDGPQSGNENPAPDIIIVVDQLEINSIIGTGDIETERVLVRHVGDTELSLAGWQIRDEQGSIFTFPALTMFSGGAVTVFSKVGINTVVELYWGRDQSVWEVGETATLLDPDGNPQATYSIP